MLRIAHESPNQTLDYSLENQWPKSENPEKTLSSDSGVVPTDSFDTPILPVQILLQADPQFLSLSKNLQLFANDRMDQSRQGIKLSEPEAKIIQVALRLDALYNRPWDRLNPRELLQEAQKLWAEVDSVVFLQDSERELLGRAILGLLTLVWQSAPFESPLCGASVKASAKILIAIKDYATARELLYFYRLSLKHGGSFTTDPGISIDPQASFDPSISNDPELDRLIREVEKTPLERQSQQVEQFRIHLREIQFAYVQAMQLQGRADSLRKQGRPDLHAAFQAKAEGNFQQALQLFQRLSDRSKGQHSNLRFDFDLAMMHFAILDAHGDFSEARLALGRAVEIEKRMLSHRQNLGGKVTTEERQGLQDKLKGYDELLLHRLLELEAFTQRQGRTQRNPLDIQKIVDFHAALQDVRLAWEFYDETGDPTQPNASAKKREQNFWKQELHFVQIRHLMAQLQKFQKDQEPEKVAALTTYIEAQLAQWDASLVTGSKWRRDVYKLKIELCERLGRDEEMFSILEEAHQLMPGSFAKLRRGKLAALKPALRDLSQGIEHLKSLLLKKPTALEPTWQPLEQWQQQLALELDLVELCQKYLKVAARLGEDSGAIRTDLVDLYTDLAFRFKLSHQLFESFRSKSLPDPQRQKIIALCGDYLRDSKKVSESPQGLSGKLAKLFEDFSVEFIAQGLQSNVQGSDSPKRHDYQALALRNMLAIDKAIPELLSTEIWTAEQRRAFLRASVEMNIASSDMAPESQEIFQKARQKQREQLSKWLEDVPADLDYSSLRKDGYLAFEDVLQCIGIAQQHEKTQPAKSLQQYQKALELLKAKKTLPGDAKAYVAERLLFAEVLDNLGNCTEAVIQLREAKRFAKEKLPEKIEEIETKFLAYKQHLLEASGLKLQGLQDESLPYERQIDSLRQCLEMYRILRDDYQVFQADAIIKILEENLTEVQEAQDRGEPFAFKLYREALQVKQHQQITLYRSKLLEVRNHSAGSNSESIVMLHQVVSEELSTINRQFLRELRHFVETNREEGNQYIFDLKARRGIIPFNDASRRDNRAKEMLTMLQVLETLDGEANTQTIGERSAALKRIYLSGQASPSQKAAYKTLTSLSKKDSQLYFLLQKMPDMLPAAFEGDVVAGSQLLDFIRHLRGSRDATQIVSQWLEAMFAKAYQEAEDAIPQIEKDFQYRFEHGRERFLQNYREVNLALARMDRLEYHRRFGEDGPSLEQLGELSQQVAEQRYQEWLRRTTQQKIESWYQASLSDPLRSKLPPLAAEAWGLYTDVTDCLDLTFELSDATIRHIADEVVWQAPLAILSAGQINALRGAMLAVKLGLNAKRGERIVSALRLATRLERGWESVDRWFDRYKMATHVAGWGSNAFAYEGLDAWGRRRAFDWGNVPFNFLSNAALFGPNVWHQGRYTAGGYSLKQMRNDPWLPRRQTRVQIEGLRRRGHDIDFGNLEHLAWFNWQKLKNLGKYEGDNGSQQILLSLATGLAQRGWRGEMPHGRDEWNQFVGDTVLSVVVADKADRMFNFGLRHFGRKVDNRSWALEDWVDGIEQRLTLESKVYGILMYRPDWKNHLFGEVENPDHAERRERTLNFIGKAPHDVLASIANSRVLTRQDFNSDAEFEEYQKANEIHNRRELRGMGEVAPKAGEESNASPEQNTQAPRSHPAEDPFFKPVEGVDYEAYMGTHGIVIRLLEPPHSAEFIDLYVMQIVRDILEKVGNGELSFVMARRVVVEAVGWTSEISPSHQLERILQELAESVNLSLSLKLHLRGMSQPYVQEFYPGRRQAEAMQRAGNIPMRLAALDNPANGKLDPTTDLFKETRELQTLLDQQVEMLATKVQELPKGEVEAKTPEERAKNAEEKDAKQFYQEQLAEIRHRAEYWRNRLEWIERILPEIRGAAPRRQLQKELRDIRDGQGILFHERLGHILGDLIAPGPMPGDDVIPIRGLLDIDRAQRRAAQKALAPAPKADDITPETETGPEVETGPDGKEYQKVQSDKNYPFGFGDELKARPHQIEPVNKLRAELRLLAAKYGPHFQGPAFLHNGARSLHPWIDLLRSFEMETGTGKTLTFVSMVAAVMESPLYDAKRGDIIPILIHRRDLVQQIKQTLLQIVPYANRKLGHHVILKVYQRSGNRKATYFRAQKKDGEWVWEQIKVKKGEKAPQAQILLVSVQSADSDSKLRKTKVSRDEKKLGAEALVENEDALDVETESSRVRSDQEDLKAFEIELKNDLGEKGVIPAILVDESQGLEKAEEENKAVLQTYLNSDQRDNFYAKISGQRDYGVWLNTVFALRRQTPNALMLTFSATRHPGKGRAFHTLDALTAMRRKNIPHTHVLKSVGLSKEEMAKVEVKVVKGQKKFVENSIVAALKKPNAGGIRQYHENAFVDLMNARGEEGQKQGWITERGNPRGQRRFLPIVGFTRTIELAHLGARDHQYLCKKYQNRNVIALGDEFGKINPKLYDELVKLYWSGEAYAGPDIPGIIKNGDHVDGLTAALSGHTDETLRNRILRDMASFGDQGPGPVEAVFGSEILRVGVDIPEAYVVFDFDPSFTRGRKGQTKGRLQRFDKAHLNPDGTLKRNHPKLVVEAMHDREGLVHVGDLFFGAARYKEMPMGAMLDPLTGQVVKKINFNGSTDTEVRHLDVTGMPRLRGARPRSEPSANNAPKPEAAPEPKPTSNKPKTPGQKREWIHLGHELKAIMERDFNNDPQWLSLYLHIDLNTVEALLQGRGWSQVDVERIATLLYLDDRELFARIKADVLSGDKGDPRLTEAHYALLIQAYAAMQNAEAQHDFEKNDFNLTHRFGEKNSDWVFSADLGAALQERRLTTSAWNRALATMGLFFRDRAHTLEARSKQDTDNHPLYIEFQRALDKYESLVEQAFTYRRWRYTAVLESKDPASAYAKLLQMAREVVVVDLQGVLAGKVLDTLPLQSPDAVLRRWIDQAYPSADADTLLSQVEILLKAAGHPEGEIQPLIDLARNHLADIRDKAQKLAPIADNLDKTYQDIQAKLKPDAPTEDGDSNNKEAEAAKPGDPQPETAPNDPAKPAEAPKPKPRAVDPLKPWNRLQDLKQLLIDNTDLEAADREKITALILDAESRLSVPSAAVPTEGKTRPSTQPPDRPGIATKDDAKDPAPASKDSPLKNDADPTASKSETPASKDVETTSKKPEKKPITTASDKKPASKKPARFQDSDEFLMLEEEQKTALRSYIDRHGGALYPSDAVIAELLKDETLVGLLLDVDEAHWAQESSDILWAAYDDHIAREWHQILDLSETDARALVALYVLDSEVASHRRNRPIVVERTRVTPKPQDRDEGAPTTKAPSPAAAEPKTETPEPAKALPKGWIGDEAVNAKTPRGRLRTALIPLILAKGEGDIFAFLRTQSLEVEIRKIMGGNDPLTGTPAKKAEAILKLVRWIRTLELEPEVLTGLEDLLVDFAGEELGWEAIPTEVEPYFKDLRHRVVLLTGGYPRPGDLSGLKPEVLEIAYKILKKPILVKDSVDVLECLRDLREFDIHLRILADPAGSIDLSQRKEPAYSRVNDVILGLLPFSIFNQDTQEARWLRVIFMIDRTASRYNKAANRADSKLNHEKTIATFYPEALLAQLRLKPANRLDLMNPLNTAQMIAWLKEGFSQLCDTQKIGFSDPNNLLSGLTTESLGHKSQEDFSGTQANVYHEMKKVLAFNGLGIGSGPSITSRLGTHADIKLKALNLWVAVVGMEETNFLTHVRAEELYEKHIKTLSGFPESELPTLKDFYEGPVQALLTLDTPDSPQAKVARTKVLGHALADLIAAKNMNLGGDPADQAEAEVRASIDSRLEFRPSSGKIDRLTDNEAKAIRQCLVEYIKNAVPLDTLLGPLNQQQRIAFLRELENPLASVSAHPREAQEKIHHLAKKYLPAGEAREFQSSRKVHGVREKLRTELQQFDAAALDRYAMEPGLIPEQQRHRLLMVWAVTRLIKGMNFEDVLTIVETSELPTELKKHIEISDALKPGLIPRGAFYRECWKLLKQFHPDQTYDALFLGLAEDAPFHRHTVQNQKDIARRLVGKMLVDYPTLKRYPHLLKAMQQQDIHNVEAGEQLIEKTISEAFIKFWQESGYLDPSHPEYSARLGQVDRDLNVRISHAVIESNFMAVNPIRNTAQQEFHYRMVQVISSGVFLRLESNPAVAIWLHLGDLLDDPNAVILGQDLAQIYFEAAESAKKFVDDHQKPQLVPLLQKALAELEAQKTASKKAEKKAANTSDDKNTASKIASKLEESDEFQILEDTQKAQLRGYLQRHDRNGVLYPSDEVLTQLLEDEALKGRLQDIDPKNWNREASVLLWEAYDRHLVREWIALLGVNAEDARILVDLYSSDTKIAAQRQVQAIQVERAKIFPAAKTEATKPPALPPEWIDNPEINAQTARGRFREALLPIIAERAENKAYQYLRNHARNVEGAIRILMTGEEALHRNPGKRSEVIVELRKFIHSLGLDTWPATELENRLLDFATEELGWKPIPANLEAYFKPLRRRILLQNGGKLEESDFSRASFAENESEKKKFMQAVDIIRNPELLLHQADPIVNLNMLKEIDVDLAGQENPSAHSNDLRHRALANLAPLFAVVSTTPNSSERHWSVVSRMVMVAFGYMARANASLAPAARNNKLHPKNFYANEFLDELTKKENRLDLTQPENQIKIRDWILEAFTKICADDPFPIKDPHELFIVAMEETLGFKKASEFKGPQANLYHEMVKVLALNGLGTRFNPQVLSAFNGEVEGSAVQRALHLWVTLVSVDENNSLLAARAEVLYELHIKTLPGFPQESLPDLASFYNGPVRTLLSLDTPEKTTTKNARRAIVDRAIADLKRPADKGQGASSGQVQKPSETKPNVAMEIRDLIMGLGDHGNTPTYTEGLSPDDITAVNHNLTMYLEGQVPLETIMLRMDEKQRLAFLRSLEEPLARAMPFPQSPQEKIAALAQEYLPARAHEFNSSQKRQNTARQIRDELKKLPENQLQAYENEKGLKDGLSQKRHLIAWGIRQLQAGRSFKDIVKIVISHRSNLGPELAATVPVDLVPGTITSTHFFREAWQLLKAANLSGQAAGAYDAMFTAYIEESHLHERSPKYYNRLFVNLAEAFSVDYHSLSHNRELFHQIIQKASKMQFSSGEQAKILVDEFRKMFIEACIQNGRLTREDQTRKTARYQQEIKNFDIQLSHAVLKTSFLEKSSGQSFQKKFYNEALEVIAAGEHLRVVDKPSVSTWLNIGSMIEDPFILIHGKPLSAIYRETLETAFKYANNAQKATLSDLFARACDELQAQQNAALDKKQKSLTRPRTFGDFKNFNEAFLAEISTDLVQASKPASLFIMELRQGQEQNLGNARYFYDEAQKVATHAKNEMAKIQQTPSDIIPKVLKIRQWNESSSPLLNLARRYAALDSLGFVNPSDRYDAEAIARWLDLGEAALIDGKIAGKDYKQFLQEDITVFLHRFVITNWSLPSSATPFGPAPLEHLINAINAEIKAWRDKN